jgi:hypothetical protein
VIRLEDGPRYCVSRHLVRHGEETQGVVNVEPIWLGRRVILGRVDFDLCSSVYRLDHQDGGQSPLTQKWPRVAFLGNFEDEGRCRSRLNPLNASEVQARCSLDLKPAYHFVPRFRSVSKPSGMSLDLRIEPSLTQCAYSSID